VIQIEKFAPTSAVSTGEFLDHRTSGCRVNPILLSNQEEPTLLRLAVIGFAVGVAAMCLPDPSRAEEVRSDLAERLTPEQLRVYEQYHKARTAFDRQHQAYWRSVDSKRDARKARRMLGQDYTKDDYITEQPPKYRGPELPPEIARIVTEVRPPEPEKPLPNVADFLESAKTQFGFVPTPTTEREFKRRYAQEALAVGLSKDQVVRIYALETGGQGTYDMQSGISPITKQGKPISSALGYAQLLHANSTSEFVKYGEMWAKRPVGHGRRAGYAAGTRHRAAQQGRHPAPDACARRARFPTNGPRTWPSAARPKARRSIR
jgi:hypothetical protein